MLTDLAAEFVLGLLGVRLTELETLWFFSDWSDANPRCFRHRFADLCVSRFLDGELEFR